MGWGSSLARALALLAVAYSAYDIRLHAIREFGRVIHEVGRSSLAWRPLAQLPRARARARGRSARAAA